MTLTEYKYTCKAGQMFDEIANDIWGDEKNAAELMGANPEYTDYTVFTGGEELYIPEIPADEDKENPETAPWREEDE